MVKPSSSKKSNEELYEEKRAALVQDILRKVSPRVELTHYFKIPALFHRKFTSYFLFQLPQTAARKEKVNESLTAVQELSAQGGMFKARNKEKVGTIRRNALIATPNCQILKSVKQANVTNLSCKMFFF